MDLYLKDKIILITASTDGIGWATAKSFLNEEAIIIINGRNHEKLQARVKELKEEYGESRIYAFDGDVTDIGYIERLHDYIKTKIGYIDNVVCNVGSGVPISSDRMDITEWEHMMNINVYSSVNLIHNFKSLIRGNIVLVSSLAGVERIGAPYAYAAAKSSIISLTKYLSDDYAQDGIRVNCVVPGNIYYKGGRWEVLKEEDSQGVKEYIEKSVPMKRFGRPEEIADMIVFLASDRASFTTGTAIVVDGGQRRGIG